MHINNEHLIALLESSIHGKKTNFSYLTQNEWEEIFKKAVEHQVDCIIFDEVSNLLIKSNELKPLYEKWKSRYTIQTTTHKLFLSNSYKAIDILNENKITAIMLKGLLLKSVFPNPDTRIMGDIDLLIKKDDLDTVISLLQTIGYEQSCDGHHDFHITLKHKVGLPIEVHFGLSKLDINNYNLVEKLIWNDYKEANFFGKDVLIPSEKNNIIYFIYHMCQHFSEYGIGIRQFIDLTLYIESLDKKYDFEECFEILDKMGFKTMGYYMLLICKKVLRGNFELPEYNYDEKILNMTIENIMDAGIFGKSRKNVLENLFSEYIKEDGKINKKGIRAKLSIIFPNRKMLDSNYKYAKKHYILLPIAWLHRAIYRIYYFRKYIKDVIINIFSTKKLIGRFDFMSSFNSKLERTRK